MTSTIRAAEKRDADAVARLSTEFHDYLRALGNEAPFSWGAKEFLRDGFGESPAFSALVAESGSEVVGYLLHQLLYDTENGARLVYVTDLYVIPTLRRQGIARAMMDHVAALGRARGANMMVWFVFKPNRMARDFYLNYGGADWDGVNCMVIGI